MIHGDFEHIEPIEVCPRPCRDGGAIAEADGGRALDFTLILLEVDHLIVDHHLFRVPPATPLLITSDAHTPSSRYGAAKARTKQRRLAGRGRGRSPVFS